MLDEIARLQDQAPSLRGLTTTQPKLVDAGRRLFGSLRAALAAAGVAIGTASCARKTLTHQSEIANPGRTPCPAKKSSDASSSAN